MDWPISIINSFYGFPWWIHIHYIIMSNLSVVKCLLCSEEHSALRENFRCLRFSHNFSDFIERTLCQFPFSSPHLTLLSTTLLFLSFTISHPLPPLFFILSPWVVMIFSSPSYPQKASAHSETPPHSFPEQPHSNPTSINPTIFHLFAKPLNPYTIFQSFPNKASLPLSPMLSIILPHAQKSSLQAESQSHTQQ